jgi:hypothetical protein
VSLHAAPHLAPTRQDFRFRAITFPSCRLTRIQPLWTPCNKGPCSANKQHIVYFDRIFTCGQRPLVLSTIFRESGLFHRRERHDGRPIDPSNWGRERAERKAEWQATRKRSLWPYCYGVGHTNLGKGQHRPGRYAPAIR